MFRGTPDDELADDKERRDANIFCVFSDNNGCLLLLLSVSFNNVSSIHLCFAFTFVFVIFGRSSPSNDLASKISVLGETKPSSPLSTGGGFTAAKRCRT